MNFTAHISNDKTRSQSVVQHSESVRKYAAAFGKKIGLENTAEAQAVLHDLGKLCKDFDDYINERNKIKRGEIDHAYAGAKYLLELAKRRKSSKEGLTAAKFIARTVISHHGLHDWLDEDGNDYFKKRTDKEERYEEIKENAKELIDDNELIALLEKAAQELSHIDKKFIELPMEKDRNYITKYLFYSGMLERFMQSVLTDADRTDTAEFMKGMNGTNSSYDNPDYIQNLWIEMDKRLNKKYGEFAKSAKENNINIYRSEIAEECLKFADNNVGICRLIVPTGGGKTLSSLRFAAACCKKFKKEKIFYIAPFMSILEQNSDVIKEIAGEENFLEHYTDFEQQIDDNEELEKYELRTEKWDCPVISTTLVQFLNTIFSHKSASVRRFHRLADSVIIIDEVQAIPLKCVNLFNLAVNFLSKICGSTVVLCTATQPELSKTEYPVLFDENRDMVKDYNGYFEKFHRTNVIPMLKIEQYTYEQAADFCLEQFEKNGNLLFVVNTKKAASTVYSLLREKYKNDNGNDNIKIIHLSTGMCPEHRRKVIDDIRKGLDEEERIICVTTQLIEAGVDISFKCVVRSLAGLDNIAQAAGWCNRNGKDSVCDVYVINLKDEDLRHLKEIKDKQDCVNYILDKGCYDDMLSMEAMEDFFKQFYGEQKDKLSYNVKADSSNTTILNLLSVNSNRKAHWAAKRGIEASRPCRGFQAFKTAGMLFNVIDSNTESVIVPYNNEARNLILDLNSDISYEEMTKKLRTAQKYTLSLYSEQYIKLKNEGCIYELKCGVWAIKDEFYDFDGIGLDIKGKSPDVLLY